MPRRASRRDIRSVGRRAFGLVYVNRASAEVVGAALPVAFAAFSALGLVLRREARHLRGPRVLCDGTGKPLTQKVIQVLVRRTARQANVKPRIHILRHTFCSHLAMRGAPARAIQELSGHQDLDTTQRYMHLSPAALEVAIRLLETGADTSRAVMEK